MKKKKKVNKSKLLIIFCVIMIILLIIAIIITEKIGQGEILEGNQVKTVQTSSGKEKNTVGEIETKPKITSKITDWNLILVNKQNKIPANYSVKLETIENGFKVDSRIITKIEEMLKDARKDGVNPWICSSYRRSETQEKLFQKQVEKYIGQGYSKKSAEEDASFWVAIPRTSEHEIGLSLDIVDKNYQLLDEKQATTATQQWLMKNCTKYGFVLRYEKEKQDKTMINHEPWHYRYVGIENAQVMKEKGFCLEEYVDYLKGE